MRATTLREAEPALTSVCVDGSRSADGFRLCTVEYLGQGVGLAEAMLC